MSENDYVCGVCETHTVEIGGDAALVIRGQLHHDTEEGGVLFVLEPDAKIEIIQLDNGQYAMRFEPSSEIHITESACLSVLITDTAAMSGSDIAYEIMQEEM